MRASSGKGFLSQVPGARETCSKTHMAGYLHLKDVYFSSDPLDQEVMFDRGDMYLAAEGALNRNPPLPLLPQTGWITELFKVCVS